MKFLHAADIHLDSPLRGLEEYEGAPVEEIRGATRRALENLVQLAIDESVDFVLIAGDLYDGDWPDYNTGLFFIKQMARLDEAETPVVVISGNHDAANKITRSLRMPGNVRQLSPRKPETHLLDDLNVAVHGRGYAKEAELDNLVKEYPAAAPGRFNIGLLHTSLDGREGHANYAPCSLADLSAKNYQYWALGHVHQRQVVQTEPPVVFPGNIQGRHARETGMKGCFLVTVDNSHQCELEFRPLDVMRWEQLTIDCQLSESIDELLEHLEEKLSELAQQHEMLLGVRVTFAGATKLHQELAAEPVRFQNDVRATALASLGERVWIEKVRIKTRPGGDLDELAAGDGPIGELVSYLRELAVDEYALGDLAQDKELAALQKKLQPLLAESADDDGEDAAADLDSPKFLAELLGEVEPLLVAQLQSQEATA